MDSFASGLANLQKVAVSSSTSGDSSNGNQGRGVKRGSESASHYSNRNRNGNYNSRNYNNKRQDSRTRLSRNEEWMKRKLESIEQYRSQPSDDSPTYHLVLLFLSIGDLPYEGIWRAWMEDVEKDNPIKVSVLCHAKFPYQVKSQWLQNRLLRRRHKYHSYRPEWGSVEITRGMIDLLYDGLHINDLESNSRKLDEKKNGIPRDSLPPPDRFLFVSESCIPIRSLQYLYEKLYKPTNNDDTKNPLYGKSWVNARNSPNNGYSRQLQFDRVSKAIPQTKIWKADQWMLLTRSHAEAIVKRNIPNALYNCSPLWTMFKFVKASDEIYFPTALALLGIFPDNDTQTTSNDDCKSDPNAKLLGEDVVKRRVTYCDWSEGDKNPVSFKGLRQLKEVIIQARKDGCLVARKFVPVEENTNRNGNDARNERNRKRDETPITVENWLEIVKSDKYG